MTTGFCENSLPEETFRVDMEMLPWPLNIFKNNMATYQEFQVYQVRHGDLVEVLGNWVDVFTKSGAVVLLDAPVPGQNITIGSVMTSFFQDLPISCLQDVAVSCPTNNHVSYTIINWFTIVVVAKFSFKWVETDKPVKQVKLGEPPPWIMS